DKKLDSIRDLRDESDRDGMRVVIELKRDAVPYVVLNRLFKHTQMQSTFGTILLALVDGVPRVLTLRQILLYFLDHRHQVVVRRSEFDLAKAKAREHILEGLKVAVDNIDEVIKIIRGSRDTETASATLQDRFGLSELQAKAILDMRLARLTGLEMEKLEGELAVVRETIAGLEAILGSRDRRMAIIAEELNALADKHGDDRRTEITGAVGDFNMEDLIPDEDMVITVSRQGYIKRQSVDTYRAQRRGGRGLRGVTTKDEDWIEHIFSASAHDTLMIFTRQGQCYWLKVWQIPEGSRQSRGRPIVNLVSMRKDEDLAAVVPVREFSDDRFLLFATRNGKVKKTPLSAYGNIRVVGLNAINIREGDTLIGVQIVDPDTQVLLATRNGMAIRFPEADARPMGRATEGVRGIKLRGRDYVVGMVITRDDANLLVVTEKGMGKRTDVDAYRLQGRGGYGVINVKVTDKTGAVIAIKGVTDDEQLMVITRAGVMNRQAVSEIRTIGRATQGVRLVNLDDGDTVVDVARVVIEDEEEEDLEDMAENGEGGPDAAAADKGSEAADESDAGPETEGDEA
ncbi:MAG: DNA gyrase subunit A, partial [Gemmatimonadetes bacterium]|nr:DNA gyrase subunit A [Gemmatimonadota bacterium]